MTHKPLFFLFLIPLVVGYCVYLDYEISEQSKVYCSQKINDEQVINDCYKTKGEMIKAVYDCIRDGYDGVCYAGGYAFAPMGTHVEQIYLIAILLSASILTIILIFLKNRKKILKRN